MYTKSAGYARQSRPAAFVQPVAHLRFTDQLTPQNGVRHESKQAIRSRWRNRISGSTETLRSITTVRDNRGLILGTTNARFATTRDLRGRLLAINSADPGLLFRDDSEIG